MARIYQQAFLDRLDRAALQALAKKHSIKANARSTLLVQQLLAIRSLPSPKKVSRTRLTAQSLSQPPPRRSARVNKAHDNVECIASTSQLQRQFASELGTNTIPTPSSTIVVLSERGTKRKAAEIETIARPGFVTRRTRQRVVSIDDIDEQPIAGPSRLSPPVIARTPSPVLGLVTAPSDSSLIAELVVDLASTWIDACDLPSRRISPVSSRTRLSEEIEPGPVTGLSSEDVDVIPSTGAESDSDASPTSSQGSDDVESDGVKTAATTPEVDEDEAAKAAAAAKALAASKQSALDRLQEARNRFCDLLNGEPKLPNVVGNVQPVDPSARLYRPGPRVEYPSALAWSEKMEMHRTATREAWVTCEPEDLDKKLLLEAGVWYAPESPRKVRGESGAPSTRDALQRESWEQPLLRQALFQSPLGKCFLPTMQVMRRNRPNVLAAVERMHATLGTETIVFAPVQTPFTFPPSDERTQLPPAPLDDDGLSDADADGEAVDEKTASEWDLQMALDHAFEAVEAEDKPRRVVPPTFQQPEQPLYYAQPQSQPQPQYVDATFSSRNGGAAFPLTEEQLIQMLPSQQQQQQPQMMQPYAAGDVPFDFGAVDLQQHQQYGTPMEGIVEFGQEHQQQQQQQFAIDPQLIQMHPGSGFYLPTPNEQQQFGATQYDYGQQQHQFVQEFPASASSPSDQFFVPDEQGQYIQAPATPRAVGETAHELWQFPNTGTDGVNTPTVPSSTNEHADMEEVLGQPQLPCDPWWRVHAPNYPSARRPLPTQSNPRPVSSAEWDTYAAEVLRVARTPVLRHPYWAPPSEHMPGRKWADAELPQATTPTPGKGKQEVVMRAHRWVAPRDPQPVVELPRYRLDVWADPDARGREARRWLVGDEKLWERHLRYAGSRAATPTTTTLTMAI